jgi:hypothetical protein
VTEIEGVIRNRAGTNGSPSRSIRSPSITVTLAGVSAASSGARSAEITISVFGSASINSSSS